MSPYPLRGSKIGVDNVKFPEENFYGARVEVGQEIYIHLTQNRNKMTVHSGRWKFIGIDIFSLV